jgi:hypothetical protein
LIRDYREIFSEGRVEKPWLIAGAGASASDIGAAAKEGFAVLAIGGAAAKVPCDVALVVDLEAIRAGGAAIATNARNLLMPRRPHEDGWPSGKPLEAYAAEIPVLRDLAANGRLFAFDLWTGGDTGDLLVTGDFDGEEVPLRLLTSVGVKMARHLGTRTAGNSSSGFESGHGVGERTSGGLAELRRTSGVSYGPYGYPVPAKVFVGTDAAQMLGVRMLQYSIDKFSSMDVSVEPLDSARIPIPKEPKNRSKTGFSFCRFDIPRLCGYSGRGVYVDADMQVFADITDLWTLPMQDADLLYALTHPSQGRTPQTSVMLLNCEALQWDVDDIIRGLDEVRYSYKELMSDLCIVKPGRTKPFIPYWWNSLEIYEPGRTSLIHYTDMVTQPWVSDANKNGAIWYALVGEALDSGYLKASEIEEAVESGHISSEIFDWIGRPAPKDYSEHRATWIPPFNRFGKVAKPEGAVFLGKDRRLMGWAWDPQKPNEPIDIGIFDGEELVQTVRCDRFGEFLARYGKGNGYHAFDVTLPELGAADRRISARTLDKRVELKGSPMEIRA